VVPPGARSRQISPFPGAQLKEAGAIWLDFHMRFWYLAAMRQFLPSALLFLGLSLGLRSQTAQSQTHSQERAIYASELDGILGEVESDMKRMRDKKTPQDSNLTSRLKHRIERRDWLFEKLTALGTPATVVAPLRIRSLTIEIADFQAKIEALPEPSARLDYDQYLFGLWTHTKETLEAIRADLMKSDAMTATENCATPVATKPKEETR
jgi:hypothetical protein